MNIDTAMNCLWAEVARYNEDSRVREAWQTLKTAVSEQTAHNSAIVPCAIYGEKHDTCKLWFNCSCGDLPCGIARHQ